jgi:hypothetical protein
MGLTVVPPAADGKVWLGLLPECGRCACSVWWGLPDCAVASWGALYLSSGSLLCVDTLGGHVPRPSSSGYPRAAPRGPAARMASAQPMTVQGADLSCPELCPGPAQLGRCVLTLSMKGWLSPATFVPPPLTINEHSCCAFRFGKGSLSKCEAWRCSGGIVQPADVYPLPKHGFWPLRRRNAPFRRPSPRSRLCKPFLSAKCIHLTRSTCQLSSLPRRRCPRKLVAKRRHSLECECDGTFCQRRGFHRWPLALEQITGLFQDAIRPRPADGL